MSAIGGPTHPIGDPQRIFELIKSCKEEGFQNKEDGKRAAAMALAKGGKVGVAVEMARTLVEHGADVNPVDKWGKTPYQNLTSEEFAKKADPRAINRMKEALESMGAK